MVPVARPQAEDPSEVAPSGREEDPCPEVPSEADLPENRVASSVASEGPLARVVLSPFPSCLLGTLTVPHMGRFFASSCVSPLFHSMILSQQE